MTSFLKDYGVPEFENLKTSTRTIMVYSNMLFNLLKIFRDIYITPVETPLTKKKKNVDKKKLVAPYGAVINVQRGNRFRGIDIRKSQKHWCAANCRETAFRGDKEVNVNTIIEISSLIEGTDIYEIKYFCTKCNLFYTLKQLKKIVSFLNQVTIVLSIGSVILNMMLFKDNFKIAGCKDNDDAVEAALIAWQDYIVKIPNCWKFRPQFDDKEPRFIFRLVMRNVDFKLGFFIDRKALNKLMNSKKYDDKVFMSQCETTGHTNVNIKMYAHQPDGYDYDCLVLPEDKKYYFIKLESNIYKVKKAKKEYTTFIVFSSSEIILSGKYEDEMKLYYEFFISEVFKNKSLIEEKIEEPGVDLLTFLKKTKY
jgi:hypothetical protein